MLQKPSLLDWELLFKFMTKNIIKFAFITLLFFSYSIKSYAETVHFIDFTKVLNKSKPGIEAQKKLSNKFNAESKKFIKLEKEIRKEETNVISQKKVISAEEYKKKVKALRKKVSDLQVSKTSSFNKIAKNRSAAKSSLLKAVEPIIKKYMEQNNIRLVMSKKSIILGDAKLEITDQIIVIIDKEVSSIKIN